MCCMNANPISLHFVRSYLLSGQIGWENLDVYAESATSYAGMLYTFGTTEAVNTFLVLSGLLTALLTLKELRNITHAPGPRWGVFALNYVVKRWLRIVPALAMVRPSHSASSEGSRPYQSTRTRALS
jgi:peptidoglycan/LPS O-acetylase OafA/YrhL